MLGKLTQIQIEQLLAELFVGRIGCYAGGEVLVMPVHYVYHDGHIYAQSREGRKIRMMRENPRVCFEVEQIYSHTNWRCVILDGEFEELGFTHKGMEGLKMLSERFQPILSSESIKPHSLELPEPHLMEKEMRPIYYRIKILESSGRFEKK